MKGLDIKKLENLSINVSKPLQKPKGMIKKNFEQVLGEIHNREDDIKFSKHAKNRMNLRSISLNNCEINRLKFGFNKAQEKGVRDALIIVGDKAFVASIKNKTIITTMNKEQLKNNVFTNIDGAVIV